MKLLKNYPIVVTSPYGQRSNGWHGGIDLVGNNGQYNVLDEICAKEKGIVVNARKDCIGFEDNGSYGNFIHIDHGNGYSTVYAHLENVSVDIGQMVEEEQVIGYMGNTGHSFGGHLHFEVRVNNEKIDPTEYVNGKRMIELKAPILSPNPIDKDINKNQAYIKANNTIYCRLSPDNTIENKVDDNFAKAGYYNILSEANSNGYHWYEIDKDRWVAQVDGYVEYIAKYIEPKKEPQIEEKGQDSPIIPNEPETPKIEPNKDDDRLKIKSSTLTIIIQLLYNFFKKIFKWN